MNIPGRLYETGENHARGITHYKELSTLVSAGFQGSTENPLGSFQLKTCCES